MYDAYGLFIGGTWSGGNRSSRISVTDPCTGESLGEIGAASSTDTEDAIAAAATALPKWRDAQAWHRGDILHMAADVMTRRRNEALRSISLETGKPIAQAEREWGLAVDQFRWYAEEARRLHGRIVECRAPGGRFEVTHEPVGVVAAFTAWNFPAALVARKVAPALAAGCTVILRPSAQSPGVAMIIFDCLREAGVEPGAANLVVGTTESTYAPLMRSPVVRKVSLTGSTRVGQQMIRDSAETVKRVSMELGGNAPMIVFGDADLEKTLDLAVPTKFANAGQVCVTPDRFYIHESVHDAFVEGFAARAKALKLGRGIDPDTQMGPLINEDRRGTAEAIVAEARKLGARIVTGGQRPTHPNTGFFFEPTVMIDVPDDAKALAEENFGPIAAITRFSDDEDIFHRANRSEAGLSAYVFTRDMARAREASERLEAGMVGINSFALAAAEVPFGGIKASGMGREGGAEGIADYCNVKLTQVSV